MPLLTNTSTDDVDSYRLDVHLQAGSSQEVTDEVAAEFLGHPYISVTSDAIAAVEDTSLKESVTTTDTTEEPASAEKTVEELQAEVAALQHEISASHEGAAE